MSKSVLANKIGDTLFTVARDKNSLVETLHDLQETTKAVSENQDFVTLMNNPNFDRKKKIDIIDTVFADVNKEVANVVKILVSNLQISLLSSVLEQYSENYNRYSNSVVVKVESVNELTAQQLEALATKFKEQLQLDKVEITNVLDKSLIGGLKITYNNKVIDNTIKARLNSIKNKLATI